MGRGGRYEVIIRCTVGWVQGVGMDPISQATEQAVNGLKYAVRRGIFFFSFVKELNFAKPRPGCNCKVSRLTVADVKSLSLRSPGTSMMKGSKRKRRVRKERAGAR